MDKIESKIKNLYDVEGLSAETIFCAVSDSSKNMAVFIADMQTGKSIWSDYAINYFDFPEDYHDRVDEVWQALIHPDDLEAYREDVAAVSSGRKDTHHFQYRVKNPAGVYVWVECQGCVKTDRISQKKFFIGYIIFLEKTGIFDPLTGCLNIKEFYSTNYQSHLGFVLLGIDGFRKVINRIGFSESNTILRILGECLQRNNMNRPVYRMTGDEFILVLPPNSKEEFEYLHETVMADFMQEVEKFHSGLKVKFSAAATYYNPKKDSKESVLKRLEHTLDYAKQFGAGTFKMYSSSVDEKYERAVRIQEAMTKAIANNFDGFRLVYQPIVRNDDCTVDGAEALLRFVDDELGMISPAEFIPILETSGEIRQVGAWVAENVILQKVKWEKLHPGIKLGFNTSLAQYNDDSFSRRVAELVAENKIEPTDIIVELTESQKLDDPAHLRKMLKPLVEQNIWIMLDDFGMEASNFAWVKDLTVNGIKVDHSFVRTMIGSGNEYRDRVNIAIVSSINYMAKQLGLRVIVEGVETEEIANLLAKMNIHFTQGYYYSRPVGIEEFEQTWLRK